MKKLSLFLTGAVISALSFGQDYYPFPDSNAIWNEYSVHVENPQNVAYKIRYGMIGDTTIGNRQYSKIYKLINDTCLNINNAEYFGAIREEAKQVFAIIEYFGETEILMYDFSMAEGDTIYSNAPEGYMSQPTVISEIDNIVLFDGTTRKRFRINESTDEFWIEGIGSQGGLFTPVIAQITNYYEPHLSCFKQNELTTYLSNFSCNKCFCMLETSITDLHGSTNKIQLYPNPATDYLNIDFELQNGMPVINLFNANGRLINSQISNTFPIRMNIGNLPDGIYLIQITTDNTSINKKFLKTD